MLQSWYQKTALGAYNSKTAWYKTQLFSQMLSVILKEWKFCCIRLHFVLWSQQLTHFCVLNFLDSCRMAKKKIQFLVFLSVLHIKLSSFCWYFLIVWSFIYSTLNKTKSWNQILCQWLLHIWFIFVIWNIWIISRKHQGIKSTAVGHGQFYARVNGLKMPTKYRKLK